MKIMRFILLIVCLFFSFLLFWECSENPLSNDEKKLSENRKINGTVKLSDGSEPNDVPEGLRNHLGKETEEYCEDYLNLPMKRTGGDFELKPGG